MVLSTDYDLERVLRAEDTCRGCCGPKDVGCVVCWPCFKYRKDITPMKWFPGPLQEWLDLAKEAHD
jgi:hypothetical protein